MRERVEMLVNSCISKVERIVMEVGRIDLERVLQSLSEKGVKEWRYWLTLTIVRWTEQQWNVGGWI